MLKKISLKKAITVLFKEVTDIKIKGNKVNGVKESQSGFFTDNGQVYYITQDLQPSYSSNLDLDKGGVMYRKAKDYKDFSGDTNKWNFSELLSKHGYRV